MNPDDLVALNEEIAGMARAGLPLDQGLAALAREMGGGRLRQVTETLAADLRQGLSLPEALDRQSGRIPPYYAGLIAAAIRTRRIPDVLTTLTVHTRAMADLRTTIREALFYPVVVLVVALALTGVLFGFILPQFARVFSGFNMQLPFLSEKLLRLSENPYPLILVPAALVLLLLAVRFVLRRSSWGRQRWARFIYAVPVIGTLVRASRLASFTDLLGILVDQEVPLPDAFRLAGQASTDPLTAGSAREVADDLSHGLPLRAVLQNRGLVPEWVGWTVGWGEHQGRLGASLHQVAEMYRRQVEMRAALVRNVLPPFLIIATAGVFVTLFVGILMLPMIKLLEGLSK